MGRKAEVVDIVRFMCFKLFLLTAIECILVTYACGDNFLLTWTMNQNECTFKVEVIRKYMFL